MNYIEYIIGEEHWRLRAFIRKYSGKIASLFRGALSIKKRNNNDYLYLVCHRHGKVIFDYIVPDRLTGSDKARKIMDQVKFRKEEEKKLQQVKRHLEEIEKGIHRTAASLLFNRFFMGRVDRCCPTILL